MIKIKHYDIQNGNKKKNMHTTAHTLTPIGIAFAMPSVNYGFVRDVCDLMPANLLL